MNYKKNVFILVYILTFSNFVYSQTIEEKVNFTFEAIKRGNKNDVFKYENDIINYQKNIGVDSNFLNLLIFYSDQYYSFNEINKSIEYQVEITKITKYIYGENSKYLTSLNNLASNYSEIGNFSNSLELNLEYIKISKKILGEEHPDYLIVLNNLAFCYSNLDNFNEAIEINIQCLNLRKKVLGEEHPDYLSSLNNLAFNYSKLKYNNKALETNLLCVYLRKKVLGEEHPDYIISLNNLAASYHELGEYKKSIEILLKLLIIQKKLFGEDHSDYLISLNNLAASYHELGEYKKSIEINLKLLSIQKKLFGEDHSDYLITLSNLSINYYELGMYYFNLGNYNKALELDLECLNIEKKVFREEHQIYLKSLINLASIYLKLGDIIKSLEINLQLLNITKKKFNEEDPIYLNGLNNLALTYFYLGDYKKSLEINLQLLNLTKKTLNEEDPIYLTGLNNLAFTYYHLGDYDKSIEINIQCLDIRKKVMGEEHPKYLTTLNNLARNYNEIGNYTKALELDLLIVYLQKKVLRENHSDYFVSLQNLAFDYIDFANYKISDSLFSLSLELEQYNFNKNLNGLNEQLKENSKDAINSDLAFFSNYSLFRKEVNPSLLANSFNYWLNLNGIISNQSTQLQEQVYASQDTSFIQLYEDWKLNKLQLMKYYELTLPEREEKGIKIKEAEETVNQQEQELSRRSDVFSDMKKEYSFSDIQNNLKDDEAFVDVLRLPYYNFNTNKWSDTIRYLAYVITKETKEHPNYVVIENGNMLEDELLPSYSENTFGANINQKEDDITSYNYFWKPISEQINGKKKVFVSMGGVYNNINLQTLYNSTTNKYLLDETDIQIVNNGRSFIQSRTKPAAKYPDFTATLVGFPNYNGTLSTVKENDNIAYSRDLTPVLMDSLARGGYSASPLPATKTEVETIGKTLKDKKWSVNVLTDDNATEDNIKSLNSPRVLHLATHGYFMKEQEVSKENNQRYMGMETQKVVENPLLRSGLLFAGANKTLKGDTTKVSENGILTAYEASYLNLKGTELVVLSACETGKGDIKNGEGVYGLRKSIADAGAKNIIMSLWKVDDKVTQEFMSTFYENWLTGTTIREAFTKTQHFIKDKYAQPYYWGAFVLIGE